MIQALYLHVPFCTSRCSYCDFDTEACHDDELMDAYTDALSLAVRRASKAGLLTGVKTIYIGGGTPSYLGARRLSSLVYMISVSIQLENVCEFTLEANPDSLDERMVKDLFALGVDRFSLGVQSFSDAELSALGRAHNAKAAERAIATVQERTDNLSIDLICGAPGQDLASWEASINRALELGVRHVSVYPLMLEEGTPLTRAVEAGEATVADEDLQADMMLAASRLLEQAGLSRYEVASYAAPGYEARHNEAYWTGVEYLGLGAGAASMLTPQDFAACADAGLFAEDAPVQVPADAARVRLGETHDVAAFCNSMGKMSFAPEFLDARKAALEDLMLGMRLVRGVPVGQVERASELEPRVPDAFAKLVDEGLVERKDDRFAPTQRGWLMGNEVFGEIWGLA
ncbi:MAG: radical SAM family heme chaperone HemW [Coriobacteriales bacterium]|jgi:oxygen-independent coproporphyrinogen-3 oxidase